ncbi:MAG: fibrobacter succinogenes major paralogous domain-containing protein [Fibrobacter sp.]|nr:fibrobacter succinogenes major paralogous domain-containing protein [Fibrobacter sp.]
MSYSIRRLSIFAFLMLVAASTMAVAQGTLVDKRDGTKYRTVKIGNQTWMAENLNYKSDSSFCYNNKEDNCAKYGRLYKWHAALTACPDGWHLPSKAEFETLIESVGGQQVAGKSLKSKKGWTDSGNGSDDFGFSALPAGFRIPIGNYNFKDCHTSFWSSSESGSLNACEMYMESYNDIAGLFCFKKDFGRSVRCLQD